MPRETFLPVGLASRGALLKVLSIADNTLVIFASDNGAAYRDALQLLW